MLYFDRVTFEPTETLTHDQRRLDSHTYRGDFKSLDDAAVYANGATKATGEQYFAIDQGSSHYPRFDVIRAPAVGDDVSYAFNGDYYPAGKINKISKSYRRVSTDAGRTFFRRSPTKGSWVLQGGTFCMVRGTISKWNPSF
jgi:hypothetical protein